MAIRVNDDSTLMFSLRQSQIAKSDIGKHLASIASGLRIRNASDDAAGLAIAENLSSQSRGLDVAARNIQDFSSLAQVAEAGLSGIQDITQRIGELTLQASNGTLNEDDRKAIQGEVNQLVEEIDRQADSVQFNGRSLLDGTFSGSGNGVQLSLASANSSALGLSDIDVTTQAGAQSALGAAQGAVNSIATERAAIGATVNRLQTSLDFASIQQENILAAESRITDADIALELLGLTTSQIRQDSGLFGVSQGNINRGNASRLLGD